MRIRIALSGIAAGVFCIIVLRIPYYMLWPVQFAPDWPYAEQAALFPTWIYTAAIIFCGVTIFAFGWVAARWNWSLTWRSSLLAGCGAGLIAGCLIFDFIGAFRYGLQGQEEILRSYYTPLTEHQGLTILVNVLTQTAVSIYLNFWVVVLACTFVGALGGLASAMDVKDVWGSAPREPANWLFRLSAYSLTLNGLLNIIVTIAVLTILPERVEKVMLESNLMGPTTLPPMLIYWLGYLTGVMMIFLPLGMTWTWLARDWRTAGYGRILSAAWLLGTFGLSFYYFFSETAWYFIASVLPPYAAVFFGLIVISILISAVSENNYMGDTSYRFSDWLGYGLAHGILGGTQIMMGVVAYVFPIVLITIVNIPHLTASGVVDQTPTQQITALFENLAGSAQASIIVCFFGGLIVAWIVSAIRKIFGVQSPVPLANKPDTPPLES